MVDEWKPEEHEEPSVRTWRVLALVFGFLGFVVLLFGALGLYYRGVMAERNVTVALHDFPAPRLQPNPNQDYTNFRAAQVEQLGPTGATPGSIMPIEQAMAIVAARGPAAFDPPENTPPVGPALANGAAMDGAPRAARSPPVAPYGKPER